MADETPARGRELSKPLRLERDVFVYVKNGIITDITPRKSPLAVPRVDIEAGLLVPPLVNAHTHLQLSWLKNKTVFGKGFAVWLKSLVPSLLKSPRFEGREAARDAISELKAAGVGMVGDIGGTIPGALPEIERATREAGIKARFFCEKFGWRDGPGVWPSRAGDEPGRVKNAAPCGHALYSTSPDALRAVRQWCRDRGAPFSIHLAESEEEDRLLLDGEGELYEYYKDMVLPENWTPPRSRPAVYANSLSLLGAGTLAVHGVRLSRDDVALLEKTGTALCLCPRSNASIGVGAAPFAALLESGIMLCLGTDGLTSCPDLDIRNEIKYLRHKFDIPLDALIRMATANGAAALGFDYRPLALRVGGPAAFAMLEDVD